MLQKLCQQAGLGWKRRIVGWWEGRIEREEGFRVAVRGAEVEREGVIFWTVPVIIFTRTLSATIRF